METAASGADKVIVDLAEKIESWADDCFLRDADKKMKKLFEKGRIMKEIDWKRVQFIHEDPKYQPEPPKVGSGVPMSTVLFKTTFTNKTKNPQKYTFRTERTTRSSCTVEMEECFTQGVEMSIGLKTPCEILEANAGFSRELSLTNTAGQTIEEEMTWGVDSEIEVEGERRAEAKLVVQEEQYGGRFTIKSTIKGKVRVIFTNLKDNNSFITAIEGPIHQIIKEARNDGRIKGNSMIVDGRTVVCITKGQCLFRYGLRQDVEVDQLPLDGK